MTEPTLDVAALQADAEAQAETQRAKLSLEDVVALGDAADGLQAELDELASQARVKQEALNKLLQVDLPNALTDLGLTGIDLKSGARVEVVEYISAGIKEENREAAHSWMRDNNFGDLIKNDVTVSFGKGEDEFAKKTAEMLLEMRGRGEMKFGDLKTKEQVHYSTLQSWVKKMVKDGKTFPADLFSLFIGNTAKLKKPKEA